MTSEKALKLAQELYPLDLTARVAYIEQQRDRCDADDLGAWTEALELTRHGPTPAFIPGPTIYPHGREAARSMTRRNELLAMANKLIALSNDEPRNISLSAAQNLADAAEAITRALQYAVDASEIAELENRVK